MVNHGVPKFPTIDKVVPIPCMKRKEREGTGKGNEGTKGAGQRRETKSKGK
jgi:hypothetical protein